MGMRFKIPEEETDSGDELELVEEVEGFDVAAIQDSDVSISDVEIDNDGDFVPGNEDDDEEISSDDSFDPNAADSDDDDDLDDESMPMENEAVGKKSNKPLETNVNGVEKQNTEACGSASVGGGDDEGGGTAFDYDETEEDDETVRAIIAEIKKPRTSPPEIKLDDFITDICFHPERDIIALATITGDVCLYQYANEGNTMLRTIEVHAKACRDVEFTEDGRDLLTCSKDKCIMVTDMETEKLKKFYETAHEEAINKLYVLDENLFVSGDDGGTIKMWDLRTKNEIFALKEVEDYVSQMLTNDAKKLLIVCSGGYLTTINLGARKLYVQSEPYEEDLTCMATYRSDSKLVVGTSKGKLYSYNWGQFGYHCDVYPGLKTPMSVMVPITDRIGCVAGEEGIIHAVHIAPFRTLGVVGQHNMPIESMDINCTGEIIATSSHNNDVRFWNVKYFENFGDIKYNEKHQTFKEKRHNLPSSKYSNTGDFFSDLTKAPSDED